MEVELANFLIKRFGVSNEFYDEEWLMLSREILEFLKQAKSPEVERAPRLDHLMVGLALHAGNEE